MKTKTTTNPNVPNDSSSWVHEILETLLKPLDLYHADYNSSACFVIFQSSKWASVDWGSTLVKHVKKPGIISEDWREHRCRLAGHIRWSEFLLHYGAVWPLLHLNWVCAESKHLWGPSQIQNNFFSFFLSPHLDNVFFLFFVLHSLLSGITNVVDRKQRLLKVIYYVLGDEALFRMHVTAFTHATT